MAWAEEQSWFGLEDSVIEAEQEQEHLLENQLWKTKDGRILSISSMSTQHILNSLRKIRRDNWRRPYGHLFNEELKRRGYFKIKKNETKRMGTSK